MNSKIVAITGANGFIGKTLKKLVLKDFPSAEVVSISRSDFPNIQELLQDTKPDYIFHLAGYAGNKWQRLYESNIQSSIQLFESCLATGVKPRIVIPGSAAQFGTYESNFAITEDSPQNPTSNYGESKKLQCSLAGLYFRRGLPIIIGNIFNIIADEIPQRAVVGDLIEKIRKLKSEGKKGTLTVGNLQSFRDFLHIDDICLALIMLAHNGEAGESYNICSGNAVPVGKLLELMCKSAAVSPKIVHDPAYEQKTNYNYGSNAKITSMLGWKPEFTLEKSIQLLHF